MPMNCDDDAGDDDDDYDDDDDDNNNDDECVCVSVGRWVLACSLLRGCSVEKTTKKTNERRRKKCRNL